MRRLRVPERPHWVRLGFFLVILWAMVALFTARVRVFLNSQGEMPVAAPATAPLNWPASPLSEGADSAALPVAGSPEPGAAASNPAEAEAETGAAQAEAAAQTEIVASQAPVLVSRGILADLRLDRDRARSQEREMLQDVLQDSRSGEAERSQAGQRYLELGQQISLEATLESLIRGRGFDDAVVILGSEGAQVIIGVASLQPEQVAAVADLVSQMADIPPGQIRIVTRLP